MLATLDKIAYLYQRKYKIRTNMNTLNMNTLFSLKSIAKFLLVSVVTRYEEMFKGFKKGYKISFTIF